MRTPRTGFCRPCIPHSVPATWNIWLMMVRAFLTVVGALPAATHERIALAIAEFNGFDYCLSAHTYLATRVAKLDESEVAANRSGSSNDAKADAAVRFARKVAQLRGHVSDEDVRAVRTAGYTDGEIVEIVQHVALNTWTNYVNSVARTEIDFPLVAARRVA